MRTYQTRHSKKARSTLRVAVALGVGPFLASVGCKRTPPPEAVRPSAEAAASVSAAPATPPAPRCRAVDGAGTRFLLGRVGKEPTLDEDGESDDVALPFSPEIGTSAAFAGGFAVGALEPSASSTSAVVAVVAPTLGISRRIDLGKVHGDVAPPHVAVAGKALFVAVPVGAPHGTLVRLARIDDIKAGAPVMGAEIAQGSDDSEEIALEAGKTSVLLVWDDWDSKGGHELVKTVAFDAASLSKVPDPIVVSPRDVDAEAPRLARRAGGFWGAWIHTEHAPKKDIKAATAAATGTGGAGGAGDEAEIPMRFIEVVPLDAAGAPTGKPLAASARNGHVTSFDLVATKDDGVLVLFRDAASIDEQTPGGTARLVLVRADGSVEPRVSVDEDVGSGVPLLVPLFESDGSQPSATHAFMAIVSDSGAVRFGALDADGRAKDALAEEAAIGVATPLAAQNGSLLVARPHGKAIELGVLSCSAGPAPVAPAP
jgi:hypothetical protein